MSKNVETASDVGQGAQSTDSVFDFLYHDVRRVGSFIAQIDPSGHLTGLKQTESAESSSGMKSAATVSGTLVVARGGGSIEDQRLAAERESLERTYDPLWTNALGLLDLLDERGMIRDGLLSARIGQFVKVSGSLEVIDLTMWRGLWSLPAVKQGLTENAKAQQQASSSALPNRSQRRRAQADTTRSTSTGTLQNQLEVALALVGMLPHTVQARILTDEGAMVWCSLREDGLVVSASDITLKHGVAVSGRWTMVGVLDAMPDEDETGAMSEPGREAAARAARVGASPLRDFMTSLTPAIRSLLGRPMLAYGMTPLVIFRKIAA